MAQLKLTKTELKTQKDRLKAYLRFLPTLQVKKQLLQKEFLSERTILEETRAKMAEFQEELEIWVACFGEEVDWEKLIRVESLLTHPESIAGIEIRRFGELILVKTDYDLYQTPLWVDAGMALLTSLAELTLKARLAAEAVELIQAELTTTTQRVNLFEKVKIPEATGAITKITTYLDDQARVAVGWARGAKKKLAAQAGVL